MKLALIYLIFAYLAVTCFGSGNDNFLVTLSGQGRIVGSKTVTAWSRQTIIQFLGIPYGEAPSGPLRFKPPVGKKAWTNIRNAREYGRSCPVATNIKQSEIDEQPIDLEDCLSLCVYTKNLKSRQPVMFYIYGGGFVNGSSRDHPPHYLLEKDVVLVVPQFRIGALGWASTRSANIPGNMAIMDVVLALKWVQTHIAKFGGDPKQVTVIGQSAGGAIGSLLMLSPAMPSGLFHRALLQSGTVVAAWGGEEEPLKKASILCSRVGCEECDAVKDVEKCLMEVSVEKMVSLTGDIFLSPTIRDYYKYLPESPSALVKTFGRKYPLMTGVTKHDGTFILATFYDELKKQLGPNIEEHLNPREFLKLLLAVGKEEDKSGTLGNVITKLMFNSTELDLGRFKPLIPGLIDFASTVAIKSPILYFAYMNKMYNEKNRHYLYTFDYEGEHTRFGYELGNGQYPFEGGVHHSNENIYLFSTHNLNEKDTKMAETMVELWTSFAIAGKPFTKRTNGQEIPNFSGEVGPYFHINEDITFGSDFSDEFLAAVNDPEKGRLIRQDKEF